MQIRNLVFLLGLIFIMAISLVFFRPMSNVHAEESKGSNIMFDIKITALNGQEITLNDYIGKKPLYVKFWATWCQPCRKQMPHLQNAFEEYGDKIEFIAVNLGINDSLKDIREIQTEFSLTVPIVIDNSGELSQAFEMVGTPYHVLIDLDGNVVFKGHEASSQLDKTLKLLSTSEVTSLPNMSIEQTNKASFIDVQGEKITALFFTSTWCDWYLEESRPAISKNCIAGQNQTNTLYKDNPQLNWIGVTSRLWTSEKDLAEYKGKYQIEYPLMIDTTEQEFIKYNVKDFPTLILLQH